MTSTRNAIAAMVALVFCPAPWAYSTAAEVPTFVTAKPIAIAAQDPVLQRLLKERANAATTESRLRYDEFVDGRGTLSVMLASARRARDSRMELAAAAKDRQAILTQYLGFLRTVENVYQEKFQKGELKQLYLETVRYFRIDAEIHLLQLGGTLPDRGPPAKPVEISDEPLAAGEREERQKLAEQIQKTGFVKARLFAIDPAEPLLVRLQKERANCALTELRLSTNDIVNGRGLYETLFDSAHRARDCRIGFAASDAQRLEVFVQYCDFLRLVWNLFRDVWNQSSGMYQDFYWIRYELLTAEIQVVRPRAKSDELGKPPSPFPPPDEQPDKPSELLPGQIDDRPEEPDFLKAKLYRENAQDPELNRWIKERMNCAVREVLIRYREFTVGRGTIDLFFVSCHRALDARLQLVTDRAQRLEILKQFLDFNREIEKLNQARFNVGVLKRQDLEQTRYERLTAEIDLLRAKK